MNLKHSLALLLGVSLLFGACSKDSEDSFIGRQADPSVITDPPTSDGDQADGPRSNGEEPACAALCDRFFLVNDQADIKSMSLVGNCLKTEVMFGGGCEDHDLKVVWDGNFFESFPPQVHLFVQHNAHNDFCEALLFQTLQVDVSPLQDPGGNETILHVFEPGGEQHTISYTY